MFDFELIDISDVQEGNIEFQVILKKKEQIKLKREVSMKDIITKEGVDFLDFGCSDGASLSFGKTLGGKVGLGIDIDRKKIDLATKNGYLALFYDIKKIPNEKLVDFTILSHFLEHVPDINDVIHFITKACVVSNKFVFIRQPFFDADGLLLKEGLKTFYADWHGHPNKMSSFLFYTILRDLKDKGIISSFIIGARGRISDSSHPIIHPLESPIDQHDYDTKKHPLKDVTIKFGFELYSEIIVVISIAERIDLIKKLKVDKILYSS